MKIGIDAKWYFEGNPSGRVVVRNLVDNLIAQKHSHKLYLFIDQKFSEQSQELKSENVIIVPIWSKINLLSNMFVLPYWAGKFNLDIVLFQSFINLYPLRSKKVAFIHDVLFLDYPNFFSLSERIYFSPMSWLARKANCIITISESEKHRLLKHHVGDSQSIKVVHHGVNPNFKPLDDYTLEQITNFNNKYKLPNEYLLYVGRLNIRKNLLNLVRALKYLENPDIKLVIVGAVDHKNSELQPLLYEYNFKERVIFTGHVPDNDLYLFYARSKIFCFPSYAEGFGMPPLEAMRCGIPVIISNTTSLPEVCGEAGSYIDPNSPLDIALKINLLLKNKDFYKLKRQQSIVHSHIFSWVQSAESVIQILENIE